MATTIQVHRGQYASTNDGISEGVDHLSLVMADDVANPPHRPVVKRSKSFMGKTYEYLVPAARIDRVWKAAPRPEGHLGPMMGGNHAELPSGILPIHDRYETTAEYQSYSQ